MPPVVGDLIEPSTFESSRDHSYRKASAIEDIYDQFASKIHSFPKSCVRRIALQYVLSPVLDHKAAFQKIVYWACLVF